MVMLLVATSGQSGAQTTMRPGQQIIAAGESHSMALKKDGTVWAWGDNGYGQLGISTSSGVKRTPVKVHGPGNDTVNYLTGITDVDVGDLHSLALKNDGTVWAWGDNQSGQLGGDLPHSAPVQVKGLAEVIDVEAGEDHNLAVKKDGTVWAWGNNMDGQLGDGNYFTESRTPVLVSGGTFTGVVDVAAGAHHSLAVKDDGTVWAWGGNAHGQLGDNTVKDHHTPVQVTTSSGLKSRVVDVAAGQYFSLALTEDGSVWAWGGNSYGQLGDDTVKDRHLPVQVYTGSGLYNGGFVTDVDAGLHHSLALTNGTVWAWGGNFYGQLGDGTNHDRHAPVQVSGLTDVGPPAASLPPGGENPPSGEKTAICHKAGTPADTGPVH
jgi:alpha-tubulin suppressor-like RCC1 family protein